MKSEDVESLKEATLQKVSVTSSNSFIRLNFFTLHSQQVYSALRYYYSIGYTTFFHWQWWQKFMTISGDKNWWQFRVTKIDDIFLVKKWWHFLDVRFDELREIDNGLLLLLITVKCLKYPLVLIFIYSHTGFSSIFLLLGRTSVLTRLNHSKSTYSVWNIIGLWALGMRMGRLKLLAAC